MTDEGVKLQGFSRVQIVEGKKIVGDSGWVGPNTVTNLGKQHYLCELLAAEAASIQVGFMALGIGTAPNASHTHLDGEVMSSTERVAIAYSNIASVTTEFQGTFASGFVSTTVTLQNIGLFDLSAEGSIFAGNVFASSQCANNQAVYASYQIRFT